MLKLTRASLEQLPQQYLRVPYMGGDGDSQVSIHGHSDFQVCTSAHGPNPSPVAAILSSVFFFSLDQTIVADIIPDIVDHFGEVQKLPWVSVTLLLTAAGTINFW